MDELDPGVDPRDVEAHMEPAALPPDGAGAAVDRATPDGAAADGAAADGAAADGAAADGAGPGEAPPARLGAEALALPVPAVNDPGDAALLALIDRLASLLDRTELSELEVQVGETGLVLRKPQAVTPILVAGTVPATSGGAGAGGGAAGAPAEAGHAPSAAAEAGPPPRPAVKAPLTGIWYASPAPGSAPFVRQGGEVNTGQVIGLIEAMKLFNEIKSDLAGRVVKVHAEDGKLVKAKQPLIEVEPL